VEASGLIVPRWARVSAVTAPVLLLVTATAADSLTTTGHNPIRQTLSVLAASDRAEWVMSAGIALSAGCLIAVGLGLFMVRPIARVVLVGGGASGVAVAALPITLTTTLHLTATCISAFLLALWPALSVSRSRAAPAALRMPAAIAASSTLFLLLGWTAYETQGGGLLGLAERVTVVAELVWPAVVVVSARFR